VRRRRIEAAGHPELAARVRIAPLPFEVVHDGAVELSLGDVHVRFDQIPIRLRIPFLSRSVLAGSIGPFGVRLRPVDVRIRAAEAVTRGVVGGEGSGLEVRLEGVGRAEAEITDRGGEDEEEAG
jgi:hypothetical protein